MTAIKSLRYVTGRTPEGALLLGGAFQMHDRAGLPIDVCHEEANRRGFALDFVEALADCWLNDCLKFGSFACQVDLICGAPIQERFLSYCATFKKTPDEACREIMRMKRGGE
jgi:hypothetical protein